MALAGLGLSIGGWLIIWAFHRDEVDGFLLFPYGLAFVGPPLALWHAVQAVRWKMKRRGTGA